MKRVGTHTTALNGQAFVLHIWDDQNIPIPEEAGLKAQYPPGWVLINHITHHIGVGARFDLKTDFFAYIIGF